VSTFSTGRAVLPRLSVAAVSLHLGHGNRRVIEAIKRQAERIAASRRRCYGGARRAGAGAISADARDLNRCFFVNSGSEANDQAFILARLLTGRPKIFSKYRSYHGTTYGTLGVGGDPRRSPSSRGRTGPCGSSTPSATAAT